MVYKFLKISPILKGKLLIVSLFCLSLILPVFTTQKVAAPYYGEPDVWYGWQVLLWGWAGIFDGTIAWFANPILILSLILLDLKDFDLESKLTFVLSLFGLILALSSLFYTKMWNDGDIPPSITEHESGFFLWISSFVLMVLLTIYKRIS